MVVVDDVLWRDRNDDDDDDDYVDVVGDDVAVSVGLMVFNNPAW